MAKWSIRNYNAFLRELRHSHKELTLAEARQAYRSTRDHLGRSAIGADVKRHPNITGKAAIKAHKPSPEQTQKRRTETQQRSRAEHAKQPKSKRGAVPQLAGVVPVSVEGTATTLTPLQLNEMSRSLDAFLEAWDDYGLDDYDFDHWELESSASYKGRK